MFWSLIKNKFVGHNKSNAKDRYMDSFGGGFLSNLLWLAFWHFVDLLIMYDSKLLKLSLSAYRNNH